MSKKKAIGLSLEDLLQEEATEAFPTNEVVREALREYGMFVLGDRAIASVLDGMKPVQRRLSWVLHEGKWVSKSVPVKSARVVGDTMGKYHPHGDVSIYDSLINLGWMRYPIVQRIGNYGSRTSLLDFGYAAQRYTETRLSEFGDRLFDDIHIIPTKPSFTEEHKEPRALPVRVPLFLINGSSGVAVGISADIPPHNLREVVQATLHLLENPDSTTSELMKFVKGPDYGFGRLLSNKTDVERLYSSGKGRLQYECDYHIENEDNAVKRLVITGLMPGLRKSKLISETEQLSAKKLLVSPANDEGSLDTGCRIVIEFKDPKIVTDRILPLLRISTTHNFWALDPRGRTRRYSLKGLLEEFLSYRRTIEIQVLKDSYKVLTEKLGVEYAKLQAIRNIDLLVEILKTSLSVEETLCALCKALTLEEWQAEVLLGMPIRSLMKLNQEKIEKRSDSLWDELREVKEDLSNIDGVIGRRLKEMLFYSDSRGTSLRTKKSKLAEVEEVNYYVLLSGNKIEAHSSLPLKSKATWKYEGFVSAHKEVLVLSNANVVQILPVTYLDRYEEEGQAVSLVSGDRKYCVVVSEGGEYVAFETSQKRTRYNIFKKVGSPIIGGVGADPGDTVLVVYSDFTVEKLLVEEEDGIWTKAKKRPNSKPKRLRRVKGDRLVKEVVVVRSKDEIFDSSWRQRSLSSLKTLKEGIVHIVGETNLVVKHDNKRISSSKEEVLALGKNREVAVVVPC